MTQPDQTRAAQNRLVKIILGVMALGTLVSGFVLYFFADAFGIAPSTANTIAVVFLVVGVLDYLLLHFWDRLFGSRQPRR
jgi:Na+/melibiose symporter-like transporter